MALRNNLGVARDPFSLTIDVYCESAKEYNSPLVIIAVKGQPLPKQILDIIKTMSPIEWAGAITALICVWLTVKNKIANWPWGIVSVLLYSWVFWDSKLYANAGLQVFYFLPCCIYGWWVWARCGPKRDDDLAVSELTNRQRLYWLAAAVAFSLGIGLPISFYTNDPFPFADAFTTGFSIAAQWLQAKKVFENWWLWIFVDFIYAFYLLPKQKLWVSAGLYAIFTVLAIKGAIDWKALAGRPVAH